MGRNFEQSYRIFTPRIPKAAARDFADLFGKCGGLKLRGSLLLMVLLSFAAMMSFPSAAGEKHLRPVCAPKDFSVGFFLLGA